MEDLIKEDKKANQERERNERVDSFVSILMGTILTIIIIASAALLIGGKSVTSFADIAAPFSIKFGIVGVDVFAVAFAFAGILAVVTVGLGTVYSAFGFLGLESRIKARRFRFVFVLALVISAIFAFIPNQIQVMVFTQYLNGLLLPFILIPLVIITRNKELMGKYKLGKATLTLACGNDRNNNGSLHCEHSFTSVKFDGLALKKYIRKHSRNSKEHRAHKQDCGRPSRFCKVTLLLISEPFFAISEPRAL